VFRVYDRKKRYIKDILGLEKEKIRGRPLLLKVIDKGRIIYRSPSLEQIKKRFKDNLLRFPGALKEAHPRYKYPVVISPQLNRLRRTLVHQLEERQ
jgi:hypothetical protein